MKPPSPGPTPLLTLHGALATVQGVSRLAVDAVVGVTDIVEDVHRTIARIAPLVGPSSSGRMRGIPGFVYRRVRGTAHVVGGGIDGALARLTPLFPGEAEWARRDAALAVLNGVLGDHLADTGNPLAIPMQIRYEDAPLPLDRTSLAARFGPRHDRLLILAHGLCMNDLAWSRDGHNHGATLARDLGVTPLYLRYNSGLPIATNGRAFAAMLDDLVRSWPVPIREVAILGHSMGGLVARSAIHYGSAAEHAWVRTVKRLVFLGTPHHGSPLERAGNRVDLALGVSPYTSPFTRLGLIRSAAVQDLRYGTILDGDAPGHRTPSFVPLPRDVDCFAVAATPQKQPGGALDALPGDGLVPVVSALGRRTGVAPSLAIPDAHQHIAYGLNHFDLLGSRAVYDQLVRWMAGDV